MTDSQLAQFLSGAGNCPYRDLVTYHIERQTVEQLQKAAVGESLLLPDELQSLVEPYIDAINLRVCNNKGFWDSATCRRAFEEIIGVALEVLPLKGQIDNVRDALKPENHGLSYALFQVATLNFAYSAPLERKQRRLMRVRNAFPIWSTFALIYPIGAALYIYQQSGSVLVAIGYGLANLGYLLGAAGIVTGTFLVFGLRKRWQVLLTAGVIWAIGALVPNVAVRPFLR